MHHTTPSRHRRAAVALAAVLAITTAACSSDGGGASTASGASTSVSSAPDTADTTDATELVAPPAALVDEVQGILDASLEPGAIDWDCCGADAPATGVIVGVRAPGRTDLLLASGETVEGATLSPDASFNVGSLTANLVQTLGFQLLDEGVLDPDATLDEWAPELPEADEVTVEMLLDSSNGWGGFDGVDLTHITADFERAWTLDEILPTVADIPRLSPPGTFNGDTDEIAMVALAQVIEQTTGKPLAEVLDEQVSMPLALDQTFVSNGTDLPDDFMAGMFVLEDQAYDTTMFPNTSFNTYLVANSSVVSSAPDLLDLLDAWTEGSLFSTDRAVTAERFPTDRPINDGADLKGLGVPVNGYCPCTPEGAGNEVSFVGRAPKGIGTDNHVLAYADGISVVLHFNSNEETSDLDLRAIAQEIHDTVAATL